MNKGLADMLVETVGLEKSFHKGRVTIPVLQGVDLSVRPGEFLGIIGQSGSGKSTLLHLLGRRIDNLSSSRRDKLRNRHFGMIFQSYHLLPELNTLENVLTPLMIRQSTLRYMSRRHKYRAAATELLQTVGLGHRLKHRPSELSGGEMQRAAIARALVAGPDLLLADEPTGNLDHQTGQEILELLCRLNHEQNLTIVMVTHDTGIGAIADRVVRLVDGRLAEERPSEGRLIEKRPVKKLISA
jgi:lipoprotein-releasing system ATP-binding protein